MRSYEFTFIASGVDPEAEDLEDRFFEAGCDDATLAFMKGLLAVNFCREADSYVHAVVSGYHSVVAAGAVVERFEPDFPAGRQKCSLTSLSMAYLIREVKTRCGYRSGLLKSFTPIRPNQN